MSENRTPERAQRYDGRVAIVTGAGSGIGKAITEGLSREGAIVIANDVNPGGLERLVGENIHPVIADAADRHTAELLTETALQIGGGRIDALFNNAGISVGGPAEDVDDEAWSWVLSLNLDASFRLARSVGRVMIEQHKGAILNTASTAGLTGIPGRISYVVSKHGLVGLTRGLAVEWGRFGIRVNAIAPGLTATGMNSAMRDESPDAWLHREATTPLRRSGRPQDQAATALFLNSDEAAYTTGHIAVVDGGALSLFSGYAVASSG